MRYYVIAGEASGDLHASHLIAALKEEDSQAEFRGIGGDMMAAEGMTLLQHYRDLAYMGFIPVLLHLRVILRGMKECREDIMQWQPDAVILVDYAGFNMKIAKYLKEQTAIPVFYFIPPKIWAWKEGRIKGLKRYTDEILSILPFEVPYYRDRHNHKVHYVGNPTADEVDAYLQSHPADGAAFRRDNNLDERPIIALLAGSRQQEVADNLSRMLEAALPYAGDYQLVLAAAPALSDEFYAAIQPAASVSGGSATPLRIVRGQTYRLLQHSTAALVTSGTATLETALFRVPQVVCYYMKAGRLASVGRRLLLHIPYISLVNLVANEEVVPELVAHEMNVANVRSHLAAILPGNEAREAQLEGYERMAAILGEPGAPKHAAKLIYERAKGI